MFRYWAQRHNIPQAALDDLVELLGGAPGPVLDGHTEQAVQSRVRIKASRQGKRLFRNNSGVLMNENGTPVRFGLANDSAKVNKRLKSSDLIGITPIKILPQHVGSTVGVFTAYEIKPNGWKYTGTEHEEGQLNFLTLISELGGIAQFVSSEDQI